MYHQHIALCLRLSGNCLLRSVMQMLKIKSNETLLLKPLDRVICNPVLCFYYSFLLPVASIADSEKPRFLNQKPEKFDQLIRKLLIGLVWLRKNSVQ